MESTAVSSKTLKGGSSASSRISNQNWPNEANNDKNIVAMDQLRAVLVKGSRSGSTENQDFASTDLDDYAAMIATVLKQIKDEGQQKLAMMRVGKKY